MPANKQESPLPVLIAAEQEPVPVVIEHGIQGPIPVTIEQMPGDPAKPLSASQVKESPQYVTSGQGTVAAPTSTEEQQTVSAGQRRINLMWEITQAIIALTITGTVVYVSIHGIDSPDLTNAFFVIIGFYYGRTNHQAKGGVPGKYDGR